MNIAFILTMPGRGSWDGRWSGEGRYYAVIRRVSNKTAARIAGQSYGYSWSDGWRASVECREVHGSEIRRLRKASHGFYGYEWMIDSIIQRDRILADHEIKKEATETTAS